MFDVTDVWAERGALVHSILTALPEWFGRPEALEAYVAEANELPMLAARSPIGNHFVGFLSLKLHTPVAAEAYVLGVRRQLHRQGCGRALFEAAERRLSAQGIRYLTVKTIAGSHPDPHYAATRRFYEAIGFEPVEMFPTLWGERSPCLMMIKLLGS
jgi:ribosomal protein S18 acetylase RimI-like enzyme